MFSSSLGGRGRNQRLERIADKVAKLGRFAARERLNVTEWRILPTAREGSNKSGFTPPREPHNEPARAEEAQRLDVPCGVGVRQAQDLKRSHGGGVVDVLVRARAVRLTYKTEYKVKCFVFFCFFLPLRDNPQPRTRRPMAEASWLPPWYSATQL